MTTVSIRRLSLMALAVAIGVIGMRAWRQPISLPVAIPDAARLPSFANPTLPTWSSAEPVSKFRDAIERPLFHWTRRPLPPRPVLETASITASITPPALPNLSLRGAVITPLKRIAIVEKQGESEYLHLTEGQSLDGWTVGKIEASKMIFISGIQKIELNLLPLEK